MRRLFAVLAVALLPCLNLSAQSRVSAQVEVKTLKDGNVATSEKSVYCSGNGRLVVAMKRPVEYIMLTGTTGGSIYYFPGSNEYFTDASGVSSSRDELLTIFLLGRLDDLGVSLFGYALKSTESLEGGLLKRTYKGSDPTLPPMVEIVYGKDYLPIYSASISADGKILSKQYLSHYSLVGQMPFPCRQTQVNFNSSRDSTIVRTVYSDVVADGDDAMFDFSVPVDAKPVDVSALTSKLKK